MYQSERASEKGELGNIASCGNTKTAAGRSATKVDKPFPDTLGSSIFLSTAIGAHMALLLAKDQ